jgi:hypothetical protein
VASECKVEAVTSYVDVPENTNYLKHKLRTAFELVGLAEETPWLSENEDQRSAYVSLDNQKESDDLGNLDVRMVRYYCYY